MQGPGQPLFARRESEGATSRALLRQATEQAHGRLHRSPVFASLLQGSMSRAAYIELLLRLFGFHAAFEDRLVPYAANRWLSWRGAAHPAKSERLRRDLSFLGVGDATLAIERSSGPGSLSVGDGATALGCVWVLEGSALGGAILARGLDAILGRDSAGGGSFLRSDPGQAECWRRCCARIEECGEDRQRLGLMLAAAIATFDEFETRLAAKP